jgi:hypothetical protein
VGRKKNNNEEEEEGENDYEKFTRNRDSRLAAITDKFLYLLRREKNGRAIEETSGND